MGGVNKQSRPVQGAGGMSMPVNGQLPPMNGPPPPISSQLPTPGRPVVKGSVSFP